MDASTVLSFLALVLLLSATPGPDWAFVLGHSLGGRGIAAPLTGLGLGYLGLTIVVAAGLGTVVASQPWVLTLVTVLGVLVLVWIGAGMVRSALQSSDGTAAVVEEEPPVGGSGAVAIKERTSTKTAQIILQGTTVSGLNPKGLLLFIALLPQFVGTESAWAPGVQMFVLGIIFIASALSVYTVLGLSARKLLAGSERATRVLTGVAGAAMLVVAAVMLAQHFLV